MSLTSSITVAGLIKTWIVVVSLYGIRTTASHFDFVPRNEVLVYLGFGVVAITVNKSLSYLPGSSSSLFDSSASRGTSMMNREESDLVKAYLRHRREGETLGQFLQRVEGEEEDEKERRQRRKENKEGINPASSISGSKSPRIGTKVRKSPRRKQ